MTKDNTIVQNVTDSSAPSRRIGRKRPFIFFVFPRHSYSSCYGGVTIILGNGAGASELHQNDSETDAPEFKVQALWLSGVQ